MFVCRNLKTEIVLTHLIWQCNHHKLSARPNVQVIRCHLIFTIQWRNAQLNVSVMDIRLTIFKSVHFKKVFAQSTEGTITTNN